MTTKLLQSTAVSIKAGPFVDSVDGVTVEAGLSIAQADIRLSKAGGNIAQSDEEDGATYDEGGWYDVPLDAVDTNTLGELLVTIQMTGACPVWQRYEVVAHDPSVELHKIKAVLCNKQKQAIALPCAVVTYDDDGTTPLLTRTPSLDSQSAPTQRIRTTT